MSRATVRAGVAAWIAPPNVAGVGRVFTSFPKMMFGPDFIPAGAVGQTSGACLVVFISREVETRVALGGKKRVDYVVELHVFHRSVDPDSTVAMASFDTLVEALKTRLRSDHTLGGTIWEAGELSLTGEYGEPALNVDVTETWGSLSFSAVEWLDIA